MMIKRVKLRVSVGRQRLGGLTPRNEARYVASIRKQLEAITDTYEGLVNELGKLGVDVLLEALQPTFKLSQKYVPRDTGALAASGFLGRDTRSKFPRVVLGYGRAGSPNYAIFVHEALHIPHKAPTRSKYLLAALEEDAGNIQRRILKGYAQAVGKV